MSPYEFSSLDEYLLHVKTLNEKTFTDEQHLEYLAYLLDDNNSLEEDDTPIFISNVLIPLQLYNFVADDSLAFYEKKEQVRLFIENKINNIMNKNNAIKPSSVPDLLSAEQLEKL